MPLNPENHTSYDLVCWLLVSFHNHVYVLFMNISMNMAVFLGGVHTLLREWV